MLLLLGFVVLWPLLSLAQAFVTFGTEIMNRNVVITAHRGGAGYGPENSLSCIRRSVEAGVPSIEIDVQLTSDGHVVVCHDNSVNRTTNGKGRISEMTLDQLRALRLVDDEGRVYNEGLPLLSEVLECIEDIKSLEAAGKLFSEDKYEKLAYSYKNESNVIKALCLHVAHTCNLNCSYCFASQGKYQGHRALMSFEVGKQAFDFLIANSGTRRNLEVDFFGG